jgi:hypothetical protein
MKTKQRRHEKPPEKRSDWAEIAQRAYEFYEARGKEPGHELEDWLLAEQELEERTVLLVTSKVCGAQSRTRDT